MIDEYKKKYLYDESSPSYLRWRVKITSGRNNNKTNVDIGDVAGSLGNSGYYQVRVDGRLTLVHRVVWEMFNGSIPDGMFIDHLDGDKTNNSIRNLRVATRKQNAQNSKLREDSISGYLGVNRTVNTLKSGSVVEYWRALWTDPVTNKVKSKAYRIEDYGETVAKNLAIRKREEMIATLNLSGEDYSDRHGT